MPANHFQALKENRRKLHKKAILLVALASGLATEVYSETHYHKTIQHDSILSGCAWLKELEHGNENRIRNNLGMRKHVFKRLVAMLQEKGGIGYTRHMAPSEQVAIFLYFAVTNVSNCKVCERFQRSGDTISK